MRRLATMLLAVALTTGSVYAQWLTPARQISVSTNGWSWLDPTADTVQGALDFIDDNQTDWTAGIASNTAGVASNAVRIAALEVTVTNNYSNLTARIDTLSALGLQFRPVASLSRGLEMSYHSANAVQFSAGSIFGPTGETYYAANSFTSSIASPGGSGFVYIYIDASASTPTSIVTRTSGTDEPQVNEYNQWVSTSVPDDRYLGCVLWDTTSPAGVSKFSYYRGEYKLFDQRLYPTNSGSIDAWDDLVKLGTSQAMDGSWLEPDDNDGADLLPVTANGALVAAVGNNSIASIDAHTIGFAIATAEEADLHTAGVFLNPHAAAGPYTNRLVVLPLAPGEFSVRYGNNQDAHKHVESSGPPDATDEADVPSYQVAGDTRWVRLGASRNLRVAGDALDNASKAQYVSWGILGWREDR